MSTRILAARRAAIDAALATVARSPWVDHLVLRGSVPLRTWLGAAAREPDDVDFLVSSRRRPLSDARIREMVDDLGERLGRVSGGPARFDAAYLEWEELRAYGPASGLRLLVPWRSRDDETIRGTLQLDFSVDDALPEPPARTEIARLGEDGPGALLWAATPRAALAWKLRWIIEDDDARPKDVHDAALLAEYCVAQGDPLIRDRRTRWWSDREFGYLVVQAREAAWAELAARYPHLAGRHDEFVWRLFRALYPAVGGEVAVGGLVERLSSDLRWWRETVAEEGFAALERELSEFGYSTVELVVGLREVLGRGECPPSGAAELVLGACGAGRTDRIDPREIAAVLTEDIERGGES